MLEKIRIASPCTANWEQMAGDERVRHCAECDLDVYDFSAMTRREVEHLVQERQGRLCARFYQRPDGTMLTQDCPVGFRARVRRVSRVAGAAIAAAMSVVPGWAQDAKPVRPSLVQIETDDSGLALHVFDVSGAVMPDAHVSILLEDSKIPITGATDKNGEVEFAHLQPGIYTMEVTHVAFRTFKEELTITAKTTLRREIKLEVGAMLMGVVVEVETSMVSTQTQDAIPAKIPYVPMPRSFPNK